MKTLFSLKPVALAVALSSVAGMGAMTSASAGELSYNAAVSNMYLWRGINISTPAPAVFGGADYSFDSGFYVGTWTSSEGKFDNSYEYDLYGGYATEVGGVGLAVGYIAYLYPSDNKDMFKDTSEDGSMISEYTLGVSYSGLDFNAYINTNGSKGGNNMYFTAAYPITDKIGFLAGMNKNDDSASEWTHFNVSYAATDSLSFVLSKAQGDGAKNIYDGMGLAPEAGENPNLQIVYSFPF